jgi:hypothetical protein
MSRKEREAEIVAGLERMSIENKPAHDRLLRLLARLVASEAKGVH